MHVNEIISYVAALMACGLSAAILFGKPRSFVHRCLAVGLTVLAVESALGGLSIRALLPEDIVRWQRFRILVASFVPGVWLLFGVAYARGNYTEFLRRRRLILAGAFALPVGVAAVCFDRLATSATATDPWNFWVVQLGQPGVFLHAILLVGSVGVLMSLEKTMRASVGTMRWRIKYMILGVGLQFAVRIYTCAQTLLYSSVDLAQVGFGSVALALTSVMVLVALYRDRLLNVELYPSRTLIHYSLTALLAGIYLLVVGLLARFLTYIGGVAAFPLKAFLLFIALIALAALTLSDRVRQGTRRFVSRHFQRPEYDYRRVWETFAQRTATIMDISRFCRAVSKMVSETFEVLSVTVWPIDERLNRLTFGASTSLTDEQARTVAAQSAMSGAFLDALRAAGGPIDLDRTNAAWAQTLARTLPVQFPEIGGHRVCVPLMAGDELLGVMTLVDRVRGLPYSVEEIDLLRTIAGHVAASLLNIRLSGRLYEAKQMEAFQVMSAFFVHDLKNTASTLSLMLQNLPKHFDDPGFRQDALKAISRSVDRLNGLIGRLSLLRHKMEIHPAETDLNALVRAAIEGLGSCGGVRVLTDLRPVPLVSADADQLNKVFTNLLLNARDAVGETGEVRIETDHLDGWAVVSVSDNGCGMSSGFMEASLFRPFQSTKKQGMGIGLFQSRMIVEAHRGRMEVDSRENEGSVFRVRLPIQGG